MNGEETNQANFRMAVSKHEDTKEELSEPDSAEEKVIENQEPRPVKTQESPKPRVIRVVQSDYPAESPQRVVRQVLPFPMQPQAYQLPQQQNKIVVMRDHLVRAGQSWERLNSFARVVNGFDPLPQSRQQSAPTRQQYQRQQSGNEERYAPQPRPSGFQRWDSFARAADRAGSYWGQSLNGSTRRRRPRRR